jgi:hypothetical protein
MFKTKGAEAPQGPLGLIDVVDTAQAHLNAVKVDAAKNQRFILLQQSKLMCHLGQDLNNQ